MKIIKRVTQFPLRAQPEGDMAFNINTKQLRVYKDNAGTFLDYDSFYISPDVDAISVNGYYPLYRTKTLADAASPLGSSHEHDATDLLTAPDGVDYPLYMPNGVVPMYHGNYIDPTGDDDGDGVPNFRDPVYLGLTALPSAGIKGGQGYSTPAGTDGSGNPTGGVNVTASDITDQINNPGAGSYNDTDKPITINATGPGVIITGGGSVNKFVSGDPVTINPGDTFVYQGGMTGTGQSSLGNSGGDSAGYSGSGNFEATNGTSVDLGEELKTQSEGGIDAGTTNNTGSDITKSFTGTGVTVGPDGSTTIVSSPATIPDGYTLFVKSGGGNDNLHWDGTTNPISLPGGGTADLSSHLDLTGGGSTDSFINNSGSDSSVSFTGDGFLISPQGAVTGPITSPYTISPGWVIVTGTEVTSSGGSSGSAGSSGSSGSAGSSGSSGGSSSTGTPAGLTPDGSGNVSIPTSDGGSKTVDLNAAFAGTGTGNFDGGTANNTGGDITTTLDGNEVGVVIDGTGGAGNQQTGGITYGPGETLIVKTINLQTAGGGTPDNPLIKSTYGGDPSSLLSDDGTNFTSDTLLGFIDEFFTYDFGTPTEVTGLTLTDFSYSTGDASVIIQSSDDGENWTGGMTGVDASSGTGWWPDNSVTAGEDIINYTGPMSAYSPYVGDLNDVLSLNRIPVDETPKTVDIEFTPFTARYVRLIFWQFGSQGQFKIDQVQFATTPTQATNYQAVFQADSNGSASDYSLSAPAGSEFALWGTGSNYLNISTSPNPGFEFDSWVITSGGGTLANASNPNAATYTLGTSDAVVTATFKAISGGSSGGSSSNDTDFQVASDTQIGSNVQGHLSVGADLIIMSYNSGATNDNPALKVSWNSSDAFFTFVANPNPGTIDHFIKLSETNQMIRLRHNNDQVAVSGESTLTLEGSDGSIYTYDFSSNPNGLSYSAILTLTP